MIRHDFLVGDRFNKALILKLMKEYNVRQTFGNKAFHFCFLRSRNNDIVQSKNLMKFVPPVDFGEIDPNFDVRVSNFGSMELCEEWDKVPRDNFRNELLGLEFFNRKKEWLIELQIKILNGRLVHATLVGSFIFYNQKPKREDYE